MNCTDVDRLLSEGKSISEVRRRAAAHLAECDRCPRMMELMDSPLPVPQVGSNVQPQIARETLRDLMPARPLPSTLRLVLVVLASLVGICLLWVLVMGAPGYEMLSEGRRFALFLYAVVLALLSAYTLSRLLRPTSQMAIPPGYILGASLLAYPLLASLLFPVVPHEDFVAEGLLCLLFGLITSFLDCAIIWRFVHRGYMRNGFWIGSLVGALGGLTGVVALQFVCTQQERFHTSLWHGLVVAISVAGGGVVGWRLARRS
ncbi:MAG: hypothetical protein OHK0021_03440 [Bryobacter sp.]